MIFQPLEQADVGKIRGFAPLLWRIFFIAGWFKRKTLPLSRTADWRGCSLMGFT